MNTITVANIKCGGCEKKIISTLSKSGLANIKIDIAQQTVSFDGDTDTARNVLSGLGYPEAGGTDANSFLKKGHSYISCALGRLS